MLSGLIPLMCMLIKFDDEKFIYYMDVKIVW